MYGLHPSGYSDGVEVLPTYSPPYCQYYRVPCTRHDIFGVLVDQDAKTLAIMTIKHGGWREAGRGDMRKG